MGKTANLKLWMVILAILVSASPVRADITVGLGGGYDYDNIQDAIDAANDGNTVIVADGTYMGTKNKNLSFGDKSLTVRSENGPANCIIDCQDSGRGFYFNNGEGADWVVSGFTIRNGNSNNGGGIYCYQADPTITNCIISSCHAFGTDDYVCMETSCYPAGFTCGNNGEGGGIRLNESDATITDCTFTGNTSVFHGGGISAWQCSPTVTNCTFSNNRADSLGIVYQGYGGGIICNGHAGGSSATITDCTFVDNYAIEGGAIYFYNYEDPSPTITNCLIIGNTGRDYGGAIFLEGSDPEITNCVITGNTSHNSPNPDCYTSAQGGGIWLANAEPTTINCTISGNTAGNYGGGIMSWSNQSSAPVITNCIFWDNAAGSGYQEIGESGSSNATVTYCDVEGGFGGGSNIINSNPLFVDADGPDDIDGTVDDNLRLSASSPCIDVGSNGAVPSGITTDRDGRPRTTDGDCSTTYVVDMGAYEFTYAYFGDFAGGCDVDFIDHSVFALAWLKEQGQAGYDPDCDSIVADGIIDEKDLKILTDNWLAVFP